MYLKCGKRQRKVRDQNQLILNEKISSKNPPLIERLYKIQKYIFLYETYK